MPSAATSGMPDGHGPGHWPGRGHGTTLSRDRPGPRHESFTGKLTSEQRPAGAGPGPKGHSHGHLGRFTGKFREHSHGCLTHWRQSDDGHHSTLATGSLSQNPGPCPASASESLWLARAEPGPCQWTEPEPEPRSRARISKAGST
jgi:hypothetical protein